MHETRDGLVRVRVRGSRFFHWAKSPGYYTLCGYAVSDLWPARWHGDACLRCVREHAHPTNTPID